MSSNNHFLSSGENNGVYENLRILGLNPNENVCTDVNNLLVTQPKTPSYITIQFGGNTGNGAALLDNFLNAYSSFDSPTDNVAQTYHNAIANTRLKLINVNWTQSEIVLATDFIILINGLYVINLATSTLTGRGSYDFPTEIIMEKGDYLSMNSNVSFNYSGLTTMSFLCEVI